MMMSSADEEAYRHFRDTLEADLKQNIKPVIISLTMLAEDYKHSSQVIAKSIEEYILHVPAEIKILGLYLMDSIMKNLKETTYTHIFEKRIINLFIKVFECVDETNRKALYKLRQTWNDVFPNQVLYQIDISVKRIDPAWPVTANPNVSNQQQQQQLIQRSSPPINNNNNNNNNINNSSSSNKSILLNQTNIISLSNSQHNLGQTQSTSSSSTQSAKSLPVNSNSTLNPTSSNTTTSNNNQSNSTTRISQELVKQQQQIQPNINRPVNLVSKEPVKKDIDLIKKSDESTSDAIKIRDPRLVQRKQQVVTSNSNTKPVKCQESIDTTSPTQIQKKKVVSVPNSNDNNSNKSALKRSSPSSSSIQNVTQDIKKPKLIQHSETQKVISTATVSKTSSSPKNVNKSVNSTSTTSPPNKQIVNKIPKLNLQNTEDSSTQNDSDLIVKQKQLNKIPKKDDRTHTTTTKIHETPVSTIIKHNKSNTQQNQPQTNDLVTDATTTNTNKTKSIPSLFDIQPTPNLNKKSDNNNTTQTQTQIVKTKPFTKPVNQIKTKQSPTASSSNKPIKPLNTNNTTNNNNNKKTSDLKQNDLPKKLVKSTIKHDDFIFGNDEDVDERFIINNNNNGKTITNTIVKSQDITQQLKKLTDLVVSNKNTSSSTTSNVTSTNSINTVASSKPTNDLLASLFDSHNKIKPNVQALINSSKQQQQQQQQQPQINKQNQLETNESNEKTKPIANTQELFGMIKTLVTQLEQQNQQKQIKDASPPTISTMTNQYVEESQPMEEEEDQEQEVDQNEEQDQEMRCDNEYDDQEAQDDTYYDDVQNQTQNQSYYDQVVSFADLPPIKPRDKNENQNDSLLLIDGRSYRIQPEVRRLIKVYYHDHELFCDTRTKEVFVDQKRVYKMGEPTKEIMLNGRRVRLMYMGKRIELWIDGLSYHFRADSPPKQISITSSQTNQIKRYYVTIDSRTMDMFFDNYKVCQVNGGPHGSGPNKLMVQLAPNDFEYHEISFVCPPKRIMIDSVPRTMRYDLPVPCIEMENGVFYVIRFSGKPREIYIDEVPYLVPFDKQIRIKLNGRAHELAWGGPGFEVIIDGRPYELQFNKPSREIIIGTRPHFIYICGDAPDVKICGQLPYELLQQQQQQENDIIESSEPTKSIPPLMQPNQSNFTTQQQQQQQQQTQPFMSQSTKTTTSNQAPNINELLNSLLAHNIIKPVPKTDLNENKSSTSLNSIVKNLFIPSNQQQQSQQSQEAEKEIEKLPDLTNFEVDVLKKTYQGAIQSLYSGHQCATCGNRFNQNENGNNSRYRKHLDWHFRQNRKEKDEINKAHSRDWYYNLQDWIQYEELSEDSTGNQANDGDKQLTNSDSNDENSDIINENGVSKNSISAYNHGTTCPATDDIDDKCYVCQDPFEIFFHEEKDEWHFKDAIRVENRIYHPICYEDARDDQMSFNINNNNNNNNTTLNTTNRSLNDESIINERLRTDRSSDEYSQQDLTNDTIIGQNDKKSTTNTSTTTIQDNHLKNEPRTP